MSEFFPAAVALGSNLGDRMAHLAAGMLGLAALPRTRLTARSAIYRTSALVRPGSPPAPDYLNAAVLLETQLVPEDLMRQLLGIESACGRRRDSTTRWADRTLDLDLLLYADRTVHAPGLEIPHPAMHARGFVLRPLCDIAPGWRHPVLGLTAQQMLAALGDG